MCTKGLSLIGRLVEWLNTMVFESHIQVSAGIWIARFESSIFPKNKNGVVAQLVEQRTENPCVGSSILPHSTKKINNQ